MQTIRLTTLIDAPVERCFQLSLSVDLHILSATRTRERAVAGKTSGILGLHDSVTWQGRHFGLNLHHTTLIDAWRPFIYFRDIMSEGHFAFFEHDHHFAPSGEGTRMRDEIRFAAPAGPLHSFFEARLRSHLKTVFATRNQTVQQVAESEVWHRYLDNQPPLDLTPQLPPHRSILSA